MRTASPWCLAWVTVPLAVLAFAIGPKGPTTAAPAPLDIQPYIEPVEHKGYTQTIPGSKVAFDLVAIPGGVFLMGSPEEEKRRDDEGPQHPVKVRTFWMGKTEVTWDEYNLFRREEPKAKTPARDSADTDADAITRPSPSYIDEYRGFGHEGFPVVGVTHHAAMEYCRWLSAKTGQAYRLPTEAEWEWACRAGTRTAYFFGNDSGKLGDYAWYAKNSEEQTHPVAKKKPNPWGLYDLYGNVAEWCLDHYQKDYYAAFPDNRPTVAPVKRPTADRYPHAVRGGSWDDDAGKCRSAARGGSDKTWNRSDPDRLQSIWWLADVDFVGFRVVRAVEEQEDLKKIKSKVTRESQ